MAKIDYSKGKWIAMLFGEKAPAVMCQPDDSRLGQNLVARCDTFSKPQEENESNSKLIVSAVNSCINLNPDNPLAVAEAIEDMHIALKGMLKGSEIRPTGSLIHCPSKDAIIKGFKALAKIKGGN